MNRRTFTKLSILSTSALTSCSSRQFDLLNGIDTHCHIWKPNTKRDFPIEQMQTIAGPSGINRFVVVVISAEGNESYVLKMKEKYPGKIGIITLLDPFTSNLEQKMELNIEKGILGYRLNSRDTGESWLKGTDKMWQIAADLDVSICLLQKPNASIKSMDDMISKYPNTKVVIDHLGLVDPDNQKEVNDFLTLSKYDKCYVKVSRFFENREERKDTEKLHKLFEKVYRAFGSEQLMWGSNAPVEMDKVIEYSKATSLIKKSNLLSLKDKENIFINTADKLFF